MGYQPIFEGKGITLYNGDSYRVLKSLEKNTFDLLLTDPPYGVKFKSRFRTDNAFHKIYGDDGSVNVLSILDRAIRLLKPHKHVYVFGPLSLRELPVGEIEELIWDKGQVSLGNLEKPWGNEHEKISFAMSVLSSYSRGRGMGGLAARVRKGSVLSYAKLNGTKMLVSTQKPVGLFRELIESSTVIGNTVLDPFAGSGTTGVAAIVEGRKATLIEIDPNNCDKIINRISKVPVTNWDLY